MYTCKAPFRQRCPLDIPGDDITRPLPHIIARPSREGGLFDRKRPGSRMGLGLGGWIILDCAGVHNGVHSKYKKMHNSVHGVEPKYLPVILFVGPRSGLTTGGKIYYTILTGS